MQTQSTRVLIVEDDDEDYLLTRQYLRASERQHFDVSRAGRLEEALALLRENSRDVVLVDLNLPDSHGWATLEATLPAAGDAAVVVLTGHSDEAMGMEAVAQGAQDYLFKGEVGTDQLVRSIRYAIERKHARTALQRYQDDLERLVDERTAKLKEALDQLRAHDRAKSEFVTNVSHELRTPVASIRYAVENMLRGVCGTMPEKACTYIEMMSKDCTRIIGTISDILDVSRIENGSMKLRTVKMPFAWLVRRSVAAMKPQAESKGQTLSVHASDSEGFVDCDPEKMDRVVLNIVKNAMHYTPEGGALTVTLSRQPDASALLLEVADTGIGIGPNDLPHVTERYYRVGELVRGTGLGLHIVKEIVERHCGEVSVTSPVPGQKDGTLVSVRIPTVDAATVMVVDGDDVARRLVENQMTGHGFRVIAAKAEEGALTEAFAQRPDAIIVDLATLAGEGMEVVRAFRSNEATMHVPMLAITDGDLDDRDRQVLAGAFIPTVSSAWKDGDLVDQLEEAIMGREALQHARLS